MLRRLSATAASIPLLLSWLAAVGPASLEAAMKARRLSGPGLPTSDVSNYLVNRDAEWIVYNQDPQTDGALELYSVRRSGGTPIRLSAPLLAGVSVDFFKISPDGRRVVYRAAQETAGVEELWSVPIEGPGSASVKLHPTPVAGGDIFIFEISPDSTRVVFMADLLTDERYEQWSVPIDGPAGAATRISPPISPGGGVSFPRISPDSSRVVFTADQTGTFVYELWSAPIDGPQGAAVRLHPTPAFDGDVDGNFALFSSDSSRVIFVGDLATDNVTDLWSAPIAGPPTSVVKLNPAPVTGGSLVTNSTSAIQLSADGQRVVYYGDFATDEKFELWSSPLTGPASAATKLNLALCSGCDVIASLGFMPFRLSPDGARVHFVADRTSPGRQELWTVPAAGPAVSGTRLSLSHDGLTQIGQFGWDQSADGARIQFQGVFAPSGFRDLWSAEVEGSEGNAVPLADSASLDDAPGYALFSPDGSQVIFTGDLVGTAEVWLWSRPADGSGSRVPLTPFAIAGTNSVGQFDFLNDTTALYLADGELDDRVELFRVPVAGGASVKLNAALPAGGDVAYFESMPDRRGVLYFADGTFDEANEIWIADEMVFSADFDEEGNTSEWSSTVP